jgi:hypothetical protein
MTSAAGIRSGGQGRRTVGLLLVSLLLLISQAFFVDFALAGTPIPACCRAHGRHAASMKGECSGQPANRPGLRTVHEKCPYLSLAASTVSAPVFAFGVPARHVSFGDEGQVEASLACSSSFARFEASNRKRGPPANLPG